MENRQTCIRIVEEKSGRPYYIEAAFQGGESECFDLEITDLQDAWTAKGVTKPDKGKLQAYWMAVAKEALTGSCNDALPVMRDKDNSYQYGVTAAGDLLTLKWRCRMDLPDMNGVVKTQQCNLQTTAQRAEDAHAIADSLVRRVLDNATLYESTCRKQRAVKDALDRELRTAQSALDKELSRRERIEEDLYIKFAAVLNESKKKTREWKQRAEVAERRLEKGDATESGTDMDDDDQSTDAGEATDAEDAAPASHRPQNGNAPADMEADTLPLPEDAPVADATPHQAAKESPPPEPRPPPRRKAATKRKKAPKSAPGEMAELDAALTHSQR